MASQSPVVSFGLPVRNGEDSIAKCIDSILAQDFTDFELVICDNQSTDGTLAILQDYAAKDDRVRVEVNEENVGLIFNFNRVLSRARGTYFRWIGADDWLEPGYTSACVQALDENPDAIVATTYFKLHRELGGIEFKEYRGEFPDSFDPARRLARIFYFFQAGAAVYEPTYAMMRRDVLLATRRFEVHHNQDWLLSMELCLVGPFAHVPECLFHRTWPAIDSTSHYQHLMEMYPDRRKELEKSRWRLFKAFNERVNTSPGLDPWTRLRCKVQVALFILRRTRSGGAKSFRRFRRRELGLTREALGRGRENS